MKTKRQKLCEWFYNHNMLKMAKLIDSAYADHLMIKDCGNAFAEGFRSGIENVK